MSCVPKQLSSSKAHFIDKCFPNIESKKWTQKPSTT